MKDGYTILEFVLLVFIMGLLINILVPNFKLIDKYEDRKTVREFERDLYKYRNLSILDGFQYFMEIDHVANEYKIYKVEYGDKFIESKSLGENTKIISQNFESSRIKFNPLGVSSSGTVRIKFKDGLVRRISIEVGNSKINVKDE